MNMKNILPKLLFCLSLVVGCSLDDADYVLIEELDYVLIDQDGSTMADRSYDLDVEGFIKFLQSGVDTYKSNK